jgi:hypothetical protein
MLEESTKMETYMVIVGSIVLTLFCINLVKDLIASVAWAIRRRCESNTISGPKFVKVPLAAELDRKFRIVAKSLDNKKISDEDKEFLYTSIYLEEQYVG